MGGGPSAPGSGARSPPFDAISIHSSDSMVEIVQHPTTDTPGLHRLLYSKSKVYLHPTAFARDNIPGFVAIVKKDGLSPTFLLAWIPESLLNQRGDQEWQKFISADGGLPKPSNEEENEDGVLIDLPPRGENYAFSTPLTSIYSLLVTTPSLSSWYGSITINLVNGSTLSTLHFHDDESRSMQISRTSHDNMAPSWGGEDLLQHLRSYCHILKSALQPHLFLVDPSRSDIEAHTTIIFDDLDFTTTSSPVPYHRRPQRPRSASDHSGTSTPRGSNFRTSVLHEAISSPSSARMALLSGFSQFTRATRHAAQSVLSHPLAKPILPHLPEPVRSLVHVPGEYSSWVEKGGVGEYESARVYLAKWARVVAEEGERARQREVQRTAGGGSGSREEETSDLGVFELLAESSNLPQPKSTRDSRHPIDLPLWDSWFDDEGRPRITFDEMRELVFRRGLDLGVKRKAWPFVLGVIPWHSTAKEREGLWREKARRYEEVKAQWHGVDEVFNSPEIVEERHRIDVDCRRTDRTHPLFAMQTSNSSSSIAVAAENGAHTGANHHVERLSVILLTYHVYEKELGYVQGMSDLLSPVYVVCGCDEVESFWCFVAIMERMKQNFLRDQSGMKKQLQTLQQLLAMMDPELYRHLEKSDSLNLFFCFRWILIWFKREFQFDDVANLWECLWTDWYSKNFILFVALAVLESHRDVILRYLVEFDEVLKYCNELSMTIELESTLAQAEVLFISFSQIIHDIDRRKGEMQLAGSRLTEIRRRRRTGSKSGRGKVEEVEEVRNIELPEISDNLRELLISGRSH
ncbi:GTPase activating protein [Tulasnella sp. 419]|nr:GTPase activating protein [Tulasnella sp. 418]KAG8966341.1 GTPase activating protein [Tulasnella sp. 419]